MKRLLKNILANLGYQVSGTRYIPRQLLQSENLRILQFDDVVCRHLFDSGPDFTFIQVGAFDGLMQDPLRKYISKCPWRGIMIEPQSSAAQKLRELYANNRGITVVQAAVDAEAGERTIYKLDVERAPAWAGALASFQPEIILRHSDIVPGIEGMIREEIVSCVTFDAILAKLETDAVDLLQIDTEGADGQILSLFPFQRIRPAIVHWEVRHLTVSQREDTLERLANFGYRFAPSGDQDMIAVQF